MIENAVIVFSGQTGSGKTTKLVVIAARARRALIADPEGKWRLDAKRDREVRSAAALFDALREINAVDPSTRFRLVYRGDPADVMKRVAPGAAFAVKNLTLVIDEAAWFCKRGATSDEMLSILQYGRERRINLLVTTREPQEIHDMFFSQAGCTFFFRTQPGNGLDRIRRRHPEIANELPTLKTYKSRTYGDTKIVNLIGKEGT